MKNDEFREKFTERLLEALQDTGIREDKWAISLYRWIGKTGNNPWVCRKWMNGTTKPGKANLEIIAKELSVRSEWLEYGTGAKHALTNEKQEYINRITTLIDSMSQEEIDKAIKVLEVYAGS